MENTSTHTINVGGRLTDISLPRIMGILNATPDSFYAASRTQTEADIARRTAQILTEGGDIIDVGAYSTRPGAEAVSETEEWERLRTALSIVRRTAPEAIVSVDTFRAGIVAHVYEEYGEVIVNDVSGGTDPEMFPTVARLGLPYILTHSPQGISSAPQEATASPAPLMPAVLQYFSERIARLRELGQKDIILDPGFGFGKTLDENYELMRQFSVLHTFGLPLLAGVSRKSMVYRLLGCQPEEALNGTSVLHTLALLKGANLLRVHDVRACSEVIKIVRQCS